MADSMIGGTYKATLILESPDGENVTVEISPLGSIGMCGKPGETLLFPGSLESVSEVGVQAVITISGTVKRTPKLRPDVSGSFASSSLA
jgi:hypothetical protein